MSFNNHQDDDELKDEEKANRNKRKDFDCPTCNANNPVDEPYADGTELMCNYCGAEFKVRETGEGRFKFKEM
jgi:transcription elongation factor Elf1